MPYPPKELEADRSLEDWFGAEVRHHRKRIGLTQEELGRRVHVSGSLIGKIEKAERRCPPDLAAELDRALGIAGTLARASKLIESQAKSDNSALASRAEESETAQMIRREFLRLATVSAALLSVPGAAEPFADETLDGYEAINAHLWRAYGRAQPKGSMHPAVAEHVSYLHQALDASRSAASRSRLYALAAEVYQLAGEILFDGNRYSDSTATYLVAAAASREAGDFDLWASALVRHALADLHAGRLNEAAGVLEAAGRLAVRGNSELATRYWVADVQAEVFAKLGDETACLRSLEEAKRVEELPAGCSNGSWMRFDGNRLAEQRGTCYIQLGRLGLAETALTEALEGDLSLRRKAAVLADLASLEAQRHDVDGFVERTSAVLELARTTGSGYVWGKLAGLQDQLGRLPASRRLTELGAQIRSAARDS
jgi:transcriptional regulator with XRE-family HTH domain